MNEIDYDIEMDKLIVEWHDDYTGDKHLNDFIGVSVDVFSDWAIQKISSEKLWELRECKKNQ